MESKKEASEFLMRACHDLRTPLRGIRTHAQLLLRDAGRTNAEDFGERLAFIVDGAKRMDLLVEGLAAYAVALDAHQASFQPLKLDVLLRSALARLEKPLREAGAEVTYDELPRVAGNPDRLTQLFEQLLRNAIDHRGADAPRIHVSAKQANGEWHIAVRDNGPGVEADELERVFRPFERLRGHAAAGPGMGLAICRAIVEAHGGRIWMESEPGNGCTVWFSMAV
jgi:signal transduction histidine kinase